MENNYYNFAITPLTPVFIGTGESIDLLNYHLFSNNKDKTKYKMLRFIPNKLLKNMNDNDLKEYENIIANNDILALKTFLIKRVNTKSIMYMSEVSDDFCKKYNAKNSSLDNQLIIQETIKRKLDLKPYIPGSSIKGSIRTAVLSKLRIQNNIKIESNRKSSDIEKKILCYNKISDDPFKKILISDTSLKNYCSKNMVVTSVRQYNRNKEQLINMSIFIEALTGELNHNYQIDRNFIGNIVIKKSSHDFLQIENIKDSCYDFYTDILNDEYKRFSSADISVKRVYKDIAEKIENLEDNEIIIRLGHYSQFESVTLDGIRRLKNGKNNGITRSWAYIDNIYFPFGWAVLKYEKKDNTKTVKVKMKKS